MNVYITTCPRFEYLVPISLKLIKKYWGREVIVHRAFENEPWSDQIIRMVNEIPDSHFIWLHEEFFLTDYVRVELLKELENYVMEHPEVLRLGLQSRYDGYESFDWSEPYTILDGQQIYKVSQKFEYLCSFEASIFKRDLFLKYMVKGETPWDSEVSCSRKAKQQGEIVLITHDKVIPYKDALRRGETRYMPTI